MAVGTFKLELKHFANFKSSVLLPESMLSINKAYFQQGMFQVGEIWPIEHTTFFGLHTSLYKFYSPNMRCKYEFR